MHEVSAKLPEGNYSSLAYKNTANTAPILTFKKDRDDVCLSKSCES